MSAKHTPRPWSAPRKTSDGEHWFIGDPTGNWDVAIIEVRYANSVATAEANAKLIAAALDLLTVAKRARAIFKAQGESVRPNNILGALDAAIAKAEGGAP